MIKSMQIIGEIWQVLFESGHTETYERYTGTRPGRKASWKHKINDEWCEDCEDLETERRRGLENPEVSAWPDTDAGMCNIVVKALIGDAAVEITVPLLPADAVALSDQIGVVNARLKTLNVPNN